VSIRRALPLVAVLGAGALLLSGCFPLSFGSGTSGQTTTVETHTDETVDADVQPFYKQGLTWTSMGGNLDETTVTVPLDWSDPTGPTIELAVARQKAAHPLGSLLMNPGGPGGSGFDFVVNYGGGVTQNLQSNYDIIGFDPRGVGQSTPISCYTDDSQQDELLYGTYDAAYGTQAWVDELTARQEDWIAACQKNTGDLLGHLDAASVAHDMDVIRAVLGDEKLTYLGYSYGTYLGTMYAELFPTKVGRMVLDGAVDPLVDDLDALATQMAGFESGYRAFLAQCLGGSDCPFSGSVDQAVQQTVALLKSVDGKGLTSDDGRTLDSATAATGLIEDLYAEWLWPDLKQALSDLKDGDAQAIFDAADSYNNRSNGFYDGNGYEIYTAVTCDEGSLGTDGISVLGDLDAIKAKAPSLGIYAALDDTAALDATCSNWPYPVATLPTKFDAPGAPPILVVGTTNDPATPYAQAVSLSKQLSSGVLVTYQGEGHTIYGQGVTCIDDVVDAYFIKGTVPSTDPMC